MAVARSPAPTALQACVEAIDVDRSDAQRVGLAQPQEVAVAQRQREPVGLHQMGRFEAVRRGDPHAAGAHADGAEKVKSEWRGDADRALQALCEE